jgi:hypothetical protein
VRPNSIAYHHGKTMLAICAKYLLSRVSNFNMLRDATVMDRNQENSKDNL